MKMALTRNYVAGKRSASELLTSDDEEVDRPVTKKPATQATRKKPAAREHAKEAERCA